MKTTWLKIFLALTLLATAQTQLHAQGTAFTYQGRLNENGNVASGNYDLRFAIYDATNAGTQQGNFFTNAATAVSNGLFTVTLDFGNQFPGAGRWLEIAVQTNGGSGFSTLTPRQPLTPTPYAIFANTASNVLGVIPSSQIGGTILNSSLPASPNFSGTVTANQISGNGANVTNVNATTLNGLSSSNFWKSSGNPGTSVAGGNFLGTTDNQPLLVKVNGQQAVRYEPTTDTPNVIGGYSSNSVAVGAAGATIGGGGAVYGNHPNTISAGGQYGTIAGGFWNSVFGYGGVVSGGAVNNNGGSFGGIGGGEYNTLMSAYSWIGGGYQNTIQMNGFYSTIGGGLNNTILQALGYVTISGGSANTAGAAYATIGGGYNNAATGTASVIAGGNASSAAGQYSVVGGGNVNSAGTNYATVAGGNGNSAAGVASTVSGGEANKTYSGSRHAFIGGGQKNEIFQGAHAVIAGGSNNLAQTTGATVGGGFNNQAGSVIFGGTAATVSGGANNVAYGNFSGIASGATNLNSGKYSAIAGGANNGITGDFSTVAGGRANNADGNYAFAAGRRAQAEHDGAFVWADAQDADFSSTATNQFIVRANGGVGINTPKPKAALHVIYTPTSTSGTDYGTPTMVLEEDLQGYIDTQYWYKTNLFWENYAIYYPNGNSTFNVGSSLSVSYDETFMRGNIHATSNMIAQSFMTSSDRNLKTNFAVINPADVLEKVLALPITTWNFKTDDASLHHLGPMAQDFYAAFGLGKDDKHIATVDEEGVALAAIQGLNQKLEQKQTKITELQARLEKLEQLMNAQGVAK